jgi:hypothetical protein
MAVLREANPVDLTVLLNTGGWVFDEAEPRYTIGLCTLSRQLRVSESSKNVQLRGPFASQMRFAAGHNAAPAEFAGVEVLEWTDTASLPLLPTEESLDVFARLRASPRLTLKDTGSWRVRPLQGDLNSTTGKEVMDLQSEKCPRGFWPVFKGESFDLWQPDTGRYYAWADPKVVMSQLQQKRIRGHRTKNSPFAEFDSKHIKSPATLECQFPRIAFRRITNRTNQRTVIASLVPGSVFLTDVAPYFLWPRGTQKDAAFLLGILSSLPLDWYARRFVETHVDFHVINPFPIPRPSAKNPLAFRTIALSGRLAAIDERYCDWATAVGVECGRLTDDDKEDRIHELDAVVAHLYGMTKRHLVHIFETFHEGWDYEARLSATLKHYRAWKARL